MDYYILKQLINQNGAEPNSEQLNKFSGRYFAKFRSMLDGVYWNVITPLMKMKNGHPIKTLDVECCSLNGTLSVESDVVTVKTAHHEYIFEKTAINPLDELLK